jgi:hypothetical protein
MGLGAFVCVYTQYQLDDNISSLISDIDTGDPIEERPLFLTYYGRVRGFAANTKLSREINWRNSII